MLELAPHSRVWIYQADRFLTDEEVAQVKAKMNAFIPEWAAHGKDLYGAFTVEYGLFLVVGADEQRAPASGCSIDTLMRKVQEIGDKLGIDFMNRLNVAYEDPSTQIHLVTMDAFKQLINEGEVTTDTTVYNNLVQNVGELGMGWRTKVSESWHKNLLQVI